MRNLNCDVLRAVRTTAFNNEVAAELLRELSSCSVSNEQARRIRCAARQLMLDADTLEYVWEKLSGGSA
ncbi:hypothetical protein N5C93_25600 [Pseudomonas nitroreducens]|uniref:hypothetical protein n=1 Tax=Pseudomonas nitroreducens TaxID=46680 RepID=UPI0014735F99|nr:hypothetical protein [Pseudomonas nitroreducens]MCJ1878130.1 hypothetical protein [Pseudomonas nitroreducens]MCJ1894527.1 hypothetical protein [Pseudomonas nitroreducens]MDG9857807.1 hypothetical protein [Pseudomonas nitroreducens]MDH1076209.1 hypothetical protein [Pseudomonas nitroreducens]NMZ73581.1 hypothetical protein [Pseudomonas nitroreducens]